MSAFDSFSACEWLIKKHAPLMLRIGEPLREESKPRCVTGAYRKPISRKIRQRIHDWSSTIGWAEIQRSRDKDFNNRHPT